MSSIPCRLLVVDPSPDIQASIVRHVQGRGMSVTAVEDPESAVAAMDHNAPDIVITDLFLPGQDGVLLTQELRNRHEACPVIVMANNASEADVVQALRAGAIDYLHKPIAEDELAHALYRARTVSPGNLADLSGVCRSEHRLIVESDPAHIRGVISWIIKTTALTLSEVRRLHLRGALQELVMNAAEHGNLEISYGEKQQALAEGRYEELLEERLARPQLRTRKIIIQVLYEKEAGCVVYRVIDEGTGFNWRDILGRSPDACDGKDASGRGIFLARSLFPDLTYNDPGNEVMITVPLN
ncbi:MAG: response regulator [Nitrospira sp.]|nr:response regulator [Nitrospira sp.]